MGEALHIHGQRITGYYDPSDDELHGAIQKVLESAWGERSTEPIMIRNLALEFPKLEHPEVKVASIFVHQSPKVSSKSFVNHTMVEVGDILFLRWNGRDSGTWRNERALLTQAKRCSFPARPDNVDQLKLYSVWPTITYALGMSGKGLELNGKSVDVTGLDMFNGAQYLIILDPPLRPVKNDELDELALLAHPGEPLHHYRIFSQALFDFIKGSAGKPFARCEREQRGAGNGWDGLINDLIDVTSRRGSILMPKPKPDDGNGSGSGASGSGSGGNDGRAGGGDRGRGLDPHDDGLYEWLTQLRTDTNGDSALSLEPPEPFESSDPNERGFAVIVFEYSGDSPVTRKTSNR